MLAINNKLQQMHCAFLLITQEKQTHVAICTGLYSLVQILDPVLCEHRATILAKVSQGITHSTFSLSNGTMVCSMEYAQKTS